MSLKCMNGTLESRDLEFALQIRGPMLLLYINIFKNFIHISRNIQKYKSMLVHSRILMCTVAQ